MDKPSHREQADICEVITTSAPEGRFKRYAKVISTVALRGATKYDRRPDLGFMDHPEPPNEEPNEAWPFLAVHVEVKRSDKLGPIRRRGDPEDPKNISAQVGDVARGHMSMRPFQVFSLGIMFCRWKFHVTMWDHAGASISPGYDFNGCTALFARIVLQVTRGLSPTELGRDPTITIERALARNSDETRFYISILDETREMDSCWITKAHIFTSFSLIGRATSVWLVTRDHGAEEGLKEEERVLKSTWRSFGRRSEHEIYHLVRKALAPGGPWPRGIGEIEAGEDVQYFVNGKHQDLSISILRRGTGLDLPNSPVLHRLLLKEVGIPIRDYSCPDQLVAGLRDAVKGSSCVI